MNPYPYPLKKIGLIGGGQLARMMIYQSAHLGFHFTVLDPDPQAGAAPLAQDFIQGSLYDLKDLKALADRVEVLTYDIEHCGTDALKILEAQGVNIQPSPRLLEIIQDKLIQKQTLMSRGIPMAPFIETPLEDIKTFPVVQKTRKGGYDGRGVAVIKSPQDVGKALGGETFLEEFIPFERELGVMIARGRDGQTVTYPVVEMVFDPALNICDTILAPARIPEDLAKEVQALGIRTVEALQGVGVFGIELFLTRQGKLLVNEVAPRPHNSGHYTMEACGVCQFENHIRAVAGLPLSDPLFHGAAVMVNLLGTSAGEAKIHGLEEALKVPGFGLHLYGKSQCRPGRKMGHFTLWAPNLDLALERSGNIRQYLTLGGV